MKKTPFNCHLFVCVNDRKGARKSCADNDGMEIKTRIKEAVKAKGWFVPEVRVSQSGCLGLCEKGPNVMIYPQEILFSGVTIEDVDRIVEAIGNCLQG